MSEHRVLSRLGKATVALASVAVLGVAAAGFYTYRAVTTGLVTDDVIVAAPGTPQTQDTRKPRTDTTILLVGVDSRTDAQGNPLPREVLDSLRAGEANGEQNTDTMMLVHVPADPAKKAFAVSLPRDSYVDIAGGFGKHKLNSAYARAKVAKGKELRNAGKDSATAEREAVTAGRKNLIATITGLTGLRIDHYAEINLFGFSEITGAVGGVPVCLNAAVKDSYSGADFPAGAQTLQGVDALKFVRQRHGLPGGDLDRVRRQQAFLAGLANQLFSAGTLTDPGRVTDLVDALTKAVVLDKGWDLLGFAQQVQDLTGDRMEFRTIPTLRSNLSTPNDGSAVEVNPQQVKTFVQGLLAGSTTTPPTGTDLAAKSNSVRKMADQQPITPIDAGGVPCVN